MLERRQPLDRLGSKRRLPPAGLDDSEDERTELVAPRKPVVTDPEVDAVGKNGDRRIPLEPVGLGLDAKGDAVRERGELLDDALRLRAEVDVAGTRQGRLLGAVRDQQLDRALEPVEELAHAGLLVRAEDGHESERIGVLQVHGAAALHPVGVGSAPIGSSPDCSGV